MKSSAFFKGFLGVFYLLYTTLESFIKGFIPYNFRAKSVKDDVILITGGGNGIGQQIALRFAKLGATIVIWDINKKGLAETEKLIHELKGKVFTYECDVTKNDDVYKAAAKTKKEAGVVTMLINNAGIFNGNTILNTPDDRIKKTFDINILAHFWTVKAFLPDMLTYGKGHIVTIASLAGTIGANMMVDYCASKHAAIGFDESLFMELRAMKADYIKTTVACPYFTRTDMFDGVNSSFFPILTPPYVAEEIVKGILSNDRILIIPQYHSLFLLMKAIFPIKATIYFEEKVLELQKSIATVRNRFLGNNVSKK